MEKPQNLLGGPENMKIELKTSIFIYPEECMPGVKQYYQIAKTIAGFINGEGGVLWLGVKDGGEVTGIESDLAILGGGSAYPCRGPYSNDDGITYGGTADKYILKLKELVKAYLGTSAEKYISGAVANVVDGKIVVKVPVTKADHDYVAYVYKWLQQKKKYIEELYQRVANGTSHLEGFARDEFIRNKCREDFSKQLSMLQKNAGGLSKNELIAALKEVQNNVVVGGTVVVEGAVALNDPNFAALKSPKGFVFDGKHVCDVKGWREAYLALLNKLNALTPEKFDTLPSDPYFKKFFVDPKPREHLSGFSTAPHKYGTSGKIRAKELGTKVYFINPDYAVHKLLAYIGVGAGRVAYC